MPPDKKKSSGKVRAHVKGEDTWSTLEGVKVLRLKSPDAIQIARVQLRAAFGAKYTDRMASFIDTDTLVYPKELSEEEVATCMAGLNLSNSDTAKFKIGLASDKAKELIATKDNYSKIHSQLLQVMDKEGLDKLESHATYSEVRNKSERPDLLWKLIKIIYATGAYIAVGNTASVKMNAEREFINYAQGDNVSLIDYKKQMISRHGNLIAAGGTASTDKELAIRFITNLNGKFGGIRDQILGAVAMKPEDTPVDINAAHQLVDGMQASYISRSSDRRQDFSYKSTSYYGTKTRKSFKKKSKKDKEETKEEESEDERDFSRIRCFRCNKKGHIASQCTESDSDDESDEDMSASEQVKSKSYYSAITYSSGDASELSSDFAVLDSGSNVHGCVNQEWCTDIRSVEEQLEVVGGTATVTMKGKMPIFGNCSIINNPVNLISLSRLEDTIAKSITFVPGKKVVIVTRRGDTIVFKRNNKCRLYVCDLYKLFKVKNPSFAYSFASGVTTVKESQTGFNKHQIKKAELARELQRKLGYASPNELITLLNKGGIINCGITSKDVINSNKIYGHSPAYLKGVSTDNGAVNTLPQEKVFTQQEEQSMYTDIFYYDTVPILTSLVKPLNLILSTPLESRGIDGEIRGKLDDHVGCLNERGCRVREIFGDGEFKSLNGGMIRGAIFHSTASSDPYIERTGGVLKARVRSILHSVPWTVPRKLIPEVVSYATSMVNWIPRLGGVGASARELFDGNKLDFRELKLAFGDYCQVRDKNIKHKNDVKTAHTIGCIAIRPMFNHRGTWMFYNLTTKALIQADQFTLIPTPDAVIQRMNELAYDQRAIRDYPITESMPETAITLEEINTPEVEVVNRIEDDNGQEHMIIPEVNRIEVMSDVVPHVYEDISLMPDDYAMFCYSNIGLGEAFKKYPEQTMAGATKEVKQIVDKNVFDFVKYKNLKQDQKRRLVPSHMICKPKSMKDIITEVKARLVGGGHKQVEKEYMNYYSSTIKTRSIMTLLGEAASKRLNMKSMDIEGAYLEADMEEEVHLKISKKVAAIFVKAYPRLKKYLHQGELYVRVIKALYGLIQSAQRWKNKLTSELVSIGYTVCEQDDCIFMKTIDGYTMKIGFHVDDLLFSHKNKSAIDREITLLGSKFAGYKVGEWEKFTYLGMKIARNSNMDVMVSMSEYIDKVCKEHNVDFHSTIPATKELFGADNTELLNEKDKHVFHHGTAQCLYLAKRVRCDILATASFLCSKVNAPTMKCKDALYKLMCYLYSTRNRGTIFTGGGSLEVEAYGDAAFMVHEDVTSRGGNVVMMSGGVIEAHSCKQTMITKSSTEAELVALDECTVTAMDSRRLMIALGNKQKPTVVYEDNKSVMDLITRGKPINQRTKHISMRYFSVCELVKDKEIKVIWCPTNEMLADILTKPLGGTLFKKMRNILCPLIEDRYL